VTVKSALYAKYYFELRALFIDNEQEFPLTPLDKREAEKLEVQSRSLKEQFAKVDVKERLNSTYGGLDTKPAWDWSNTEWGVREIILADMYLYLS
jgi:hypothetical protein